MNAVHIHPAPAVDAAAMLLAASELPTADLTAAHMRHFFYAGSADKPQGLVGIEIHGADALLRSLVVAPELRAAGLGSALVRRAESHARAEGVRAIYLLTSTAEHFFARRGYARLEREDAPAGIRATREFADICPASSAFMFKSL
jgi:amino-acid N-acetyltransferase